MGGISHEDVVIATYLIEVEKDEDILKESDLITSFLFPGTGAKVAGDTHKRKEKHSGRIFGIYEAPQYEGQVPDDK